VPLCKLRFCRFDISFWFSNVLSEGDAFACKMLIAFFGFGCPVWQGWRSTLRMVKPDTIIAWSRKGLRLYWRWKSRARKGRPCTARDVRDLIRKMNLANPGWGAPRIHGELLKLGIDVGETTVAKYLVRPRRPPSQTWKTFLANHVHELVSADFFVVPTATFRLLFVFVVLSHDRRRVLHFDVTAHPCA